MNYSRYKKSTRSQWTNLQIFKTISKGKATKNSGIHLRGSDAKIPFHKSFGFIVLKSWSKLIIENEQKKKWVCKGERKGLLICHSKTKGLKKHSRPVAIIKIWNPKTEKRKVPIYFLGIFFGNFSGNQTSFQEKQIFSWNGVVSKFCRCM